MHLLIYPYFEFNNEVYKITWKLALLISGPWLSIKLFQYLMLCIWLLGMEIVKENWSASGRVLALHMVNLVLILQYPMWSPEPVRGDS